MGNMCGRGAGARHVGGELAAHGVHVAVHRSLVDGRHEKLGEED